MPETPLASPTLPGCYAHSGLVERIEGLSRVIAVADHDIDNLGHKIREAERRLITVAGEDGDRGLLGDLDARLNKLEELEAERRKAATWLAVKLAAAAISAGGLAVPAGQLLMTLF